MRLGLVAALALVVSCRAVLGIDDLPGTSPRDDDAGADADAATPDADTGAGAEPPPDFTCEFGSWTDPSKTTTPACALRRVIVIDSTAIAVRSVSIARTPTGRVGIVYNREQGSVESEMALVHFRPTAPEFSVPRPIVRATGSNFHDGYMTKLAAVPPDTLAVLSLDVSADDLGEVHLRKLEGGAEPLTDELVVDGVAAPSELALASDALGVLYAAARVAIDATTAKLSTWKRPASGPLLALPDVTTSLQYRATAGIGETSLFVDAYAHVHLLYHHNEPSSEKSRSVPRYATLQADTWSGGKTLHNQELSGFAGWSPRISVFGEKKYAAFFFRSHSQGTPPTAELRLATWTGSRDVPSVEILAEGLPADDPQSPTYRVAMAVDRFGLVHVSLVRSLVDGSAVLEYRRQVRSPGGTQWLMDVVEMAPGPSSGETGLVDMIVDEAGRPHIAYRLANESDVKYATRFDR